ncbi:cytochrome b [Roseomonas stagni]|uniref:Cytochrome b n=1 Tax=Falsiroseomonas algicola TaxID=2716930 RepID=A0A6M1LKA8_9PROT|nr:cytochrome b/b6 domain-containing protein [Falsiroseomonas algicola]NGM20743.1 cytochrome b [Falsiroseomonas algicola]
MPAPTIEHTAPARHGAFTIALHWGAALVLVAAFGLGLAMDEWPRGPQRDMVMMIHYSLGTIVLATVLLRLLRRLLVPGIAVAGHSLTDRAASAVHALLYALMVAMPVTGALDRWARGRPLQLFGDNLIPAPFPIGGGRLWIEAHELMAWTLVALVAAHAGAALWHHVIQRDDVLRRMLPQGSGVTAG